MSLTFLPPLRSVIATDLRAFEYMAYRRLQGRSDSASGGDSDEEEGVMGGGAMTTAVGDTPTKTRKEESGDDNEGLDTAINEDESLISQEIDENGVAQGYEVALKYIGFGLFHVLLMFINGVALSSDAIEVLSIAFILPVIREKNEFDITDWQNALLSSIVFLGMLFGSYLWGSLSDLSGRRCALLISLTVNGAFGFFSAFAPNYYVFLVLRFVSGFG